MINLYTAVGVVLVVDTETGEKTECKFQHVVQAADADEAHDKTMDYYFYKRDDEREFHVSEIEIFDPIF